MRLHYHPMSTCSFRVLLVVRELQIPVELQVVDLFKGEQRLPQFLKLNPGGHVPVLEHEGLILWESYAIMQYLADQMPDQTLYPRETRARADVNRWLFWCAQHLAPSIGILNRENSIKALMGRGGPDPLEVARGENMFREAAKMLDGHLAARKWICGATLSLADLAIAAPLIDSERARLPLDDLHNLNHWYGQVRALASWNAP